MDASAIWESRFLVQRGTDITVQNNDRMGHLHSVCGNGHLQVDQPNLRRSAAQTKVERLCGIWQCTKDMCKSRFFLE